MLKQKIFAFVGWWQCSFDCFTLFSFSTSVF